MAAFEPLSEAAIPSSSTSARPDALLLWYPVLDTSEDGYGHALFGERFAEFSPLHRLTNFPHPLPPTLILIGTADDVTPEATVRTFQQLARKSGAVCEVKFFPGGRHPLYAYREGGGPLRDATLAAADRFLSGLSDQPKAVH
jgi:acetyl esterase/lipase